MVKRIFSSPARSASRSSRPKDDCRWRCTSSTLSRPRTNSSRGTEQLLKALLRCRCSSRDHRDDAVLGDHGPSRSGNSRLASRPLGGMPRARHQHVLDEVRRVAPARPGRAGMRAESARLKTVHSVPAVQAVTDLGLLPPVHGGLRIVLPKGPRQSASSASCFCGETLERTGVGLSRFGFA